MVKINNNKIISIIRKKFKYLKKTKITKKSDLLAENILDSLELMELISYLEKNNNLNIKKYSKKNNFFKVETLEKYCK